MKLVLFSKHFPKDSLDDFLRRGQALKLDGFDLAVRPGLGVTPDNAAEALPLWVKSLAAGGLSVPMVTGPADLVDAGMPAAKAILSAMDKSGVRRLKLGYMHFDPKKHASFDAALGESRARLKAWEKLGREYGVRILYHTHSQTGGAWYLGANASAQRLLFEGLDPEWIGAYLDAGHLEAEGEPFELACAIAGPYLAAVGVKDVVKANNADGSNTKVWAQAGRGMVSWPSVAATLRNLAFEGPVSIHAEYQTRSEEEFRGALPAEAAFFRELFQ